MGGWNIVSIQMNRKEVDCTAGVDFLRWGTMSLLETIVRDMNSSGQLLFSKGTKHNILNYFGG